MKIAKEVIGSISWVLAYVEAEAHFMRKAVAVVNPKNLRVFISDLGGFVYHIVAVISGSGFLSTGWIHEDGIRTEREMFPDLSHPVHSITCVSDLYEECSEPTEEIDVFTKELMESNVLA